MTPGSAQTKLRPSLAPPARLLEIKKIPFRLVAAAALGGSAALAWIAWALMAFAASN